MPIYIKFDGIDGEVVQQDHKGEILLDSWSWGIHQSIAAGGGGGGAGKVSFSDLSVMCSSSKASPVLALRCASGQHIKDAHLTMTKRVRGREETYLTIELKDVLISSFQPSSDGASSAGETMSLNYEKIKYTQFSREADGSVKTTVFTWDLKRNTP